MTAKAARAQPAKKKTKKTKTAKAKSAAGKKAAAKKPAAKASKAAVKKKATTRSTGKKSAAAAPGKKKAPARKTATRAKRKPARKKAKHRPPLNLRAFRRRLEQLQSELMQNYMSVKGDSRSRESDGTEDYIDYAVSSYDREFLLSLTELERGRLSQVDDALRRIERGLYGSCTQCARLIPAKRLEVQPWARYCVRCQELSDSGQMGEGPGFPEADDDEELPDGDSDELEAEEEGAEEANQLISS